jgi:hypothetical protein
MSQEYVHFCLQPYALFLLAITLHVIYFLHLLSTNLSVLNLTIFPCHSNLLLRRRRWTEILRWRVLGYASPRLPFLWCYGVFRCSVSPRVALVFKDINYVIIILYIYDIWLSVSTFGRMCGTIDPGSCIRWVLGFGIKTGYDNDCFTSSSDVDDDDNTDDEYDEQQLLMKFGKLIRKHIKL